MAKIYLFIVTNSQYFTIILNKQTDNLLLKVKIFEQNTHTCINLLVHINI